MFGFEFLENFNYPYISKSITEFWRRWHISLSTWFRDYIYIPLGGNKKGKIRRLINIFIVWGLTGFWHGANWNFIIWGLYFAVLLVLEKQFILNRLEKSKIISHIYALFLIIIGWVIFRVESISALKTYMISLFTFTGKFDMQIVYFLLQYKVEIILGLVFATPILRNTYSYILKTIEKNVRKEYDSKIDKSKDEVKNKNKDKDKNKNLNSNKKLNKTEEEMEAKIEKLKSRAQNMREVILTLAMLCILALVTMTLIQSSYNPFIYFRF